jgi:hypothetical protein
VDQYIKSPDEQVQQTKSSPTETDSQAKVRAKMWAVGPCWAPGRNQPLSFTKWQPILVVSLDL